MTSSALIMMLTTVGTVTLVMINFFYKVLTNKPKNTDHFKQVN